MNVLSKLSYLTKMKNLTDSLKKNYKRVKPSTIIGIDSSILKKIIVLMSVALSMNLVHSQRVIPIERDFPTFPFQIQKGINNADGFEKIFNFNPATSGNEPIDLFLSGSRLYGITLTGGSNNRGLIFKINTNGTGFEKIDFGTTYAYPWSLALSGSYIIGTTQTGGTYNKGVLFRMNTDLTGFQVLYSFNFSFTYPRYFIILSGDMIYGNATDFAAGNSSVTFKIKTDGSGYTALKVHEGAMSPAKLLLYNDYLYGTTYDQGTSEPSKIFKIKIDGTEYLKLHNFDSQGNGRYPYGDLTLIGSLLYGTTRRGGVYNGGILYKINVDGSGFEQIYSFSKNDGYDVTNSLLRQGSVFYGAADYGSINDLGTLFSINTNGSGFRRLFDFTDSINGYLTSKIVLTGDTIFGITLGGGSDNAGTIFRYQIKNPLDSLNVQPKVINLSTKITNFITVKKNIVVDPGSFIDLDTTFSVIGNTQYTHEWKVKTNTGYEICDKIVKIIRDSTFYLFLSTVQGCSYSESVIITINSTTGIYDFDIPKQINIYPNPTKGNFRIIIPEGNVEYSYHLYDVSGILTANGIMDCQTEQCIINLELTNIPAGVYTIVISKNNKYYGRRKLVISP